MNILMLSWEYPPRVVGGISRVVHELSNKLAFKGHEVSVVTYREGDTKYFEQEKSGVKVYRVDGPNINALDFTNWIMQMNFSMLETANKLMQEEKFDVIHAHDWLTAFAGKTLKHSFNTPLVTTIHAMEYGRNGGIFTKEQKYINDVEWLATYESQKIIVNSNFMKNEASRIFNTDPNKIDVIPNGIDLDKFDKFEKDFNFRRNYAKDDEKIIFSIGRIVNEKGIQHLISAMPKILSRYYNAKLVIAGKGPMLDNLRELANNLGISEKVYFIGYLSGDDVPRMYKNADIAVFPSTYEPFGIVALEGMLSGLPTVVSDVGGLDEIVKHGLTGLKSYAGNSNSIADSVLVILDNQELAEKLSKNGRQEVLENYSWSQISEKTLKTYEEGIRIFNEENIVETVVQGKERKQKDADELKIRNQRAKSLEEEELDKETVKEKLQKLINFKEVAKEAFNN